MNKFMNVLCLIIWIAQLIFGISNAITGTPVSTGAFICATIVCILFYISELIRK